MAKLHNTARSMQKVMYYCRRRLCGCCCSCYCCFCFLLFCFRFCCSSSSSSSSSSRYGVVVVLLPLLFLFVVVVVSVVDMSFVLFTTCEPIFRGISTLLYSSAMVSIVFWERRIHSRRPAAVASQIRMSAIGNSNSVRTSITSSFINL